MPELCRQIYVNLTGSYYLRSAIDPPLATAAVASLWLGILAAVTLVQVYRVASRRYLVWSHLLFASVLLTLVANWLLLEARDVRYLLPMNALLVFLAGIEFFDLAGRLRWSPRVRRLSLAAVLVLEAVSMYEFAGFSFLWWKNTRSSPSEAATLRTVIGDMQAHGVRHAFSMNALLQWQITFYSNETVVARWKAAFDRYPPYVTEVDRALASGEPVAVVGYTAFTEGFERMVSHPQAIVDVDGKYFVYVGADKALLAKAQFRFAP